MPIFQYAKLVRDNIKKWHEEAGHTVMATQLTGDKLKTALMHKLQEECEEAMATTNRSELIEELADVQQVIQDLCNVAAISRSEIDAIRIKKLDRKGGFSKGVYIEQVSIPNEEDTWAKYCRKDPIKYPELSVEPQNNSAPPTIANGVYKHSKSNRLYQVIATALHTETNDTMVIYKPLYKSEHSLFARPYNQFIETITLNGEQVPRFECIY